MSENSYLDKFNNKHHYDEHIDCLTNHLAKYFKGDEITVFHEIVSLDFHLDVYFIKPVNRDYNILLTSGMSLLEMIVGSEIKNRSDYLFAELMVLISKELDFSQVYTGNEKNSWVISMLKQTARFPHHNDTFLAIGQTIQATENMEPYSNETNYVGCAILPSVTLESEFTEFNCGDNKINIYSLFPMYKNELDYKIQNGYAGFVDLLTKGRPKEIIDNKRKNLISNKGFWNIFKK
jgi:hypothetical protein